MEKIAVYIPNYNGAAFLSQMELLENLDYVVMDNCSTDDSVLVCKSRGIKVIENEVNVNRVENWIRCLKHFQQSDYTWMKWLFVGDILYQDSFDLMSKAIKDNGANASVIIFDYDGIENGMKCYTQKSLVGYGLIERNIVVENLLTKGNIFGSPIGTLISKKAVGSIDSGHDFTWVADEYICYELTKKMPVCFAAVSIGAFNKDSRAHFNSMNGSMNSILEEVEMIRLIMKEHPDVYQNVKASTNKHLRSLAYRILRNDNKLNVIAKIGIKISGV